ncbi:MAG: TldD/PmbA family protein [bacterium]
MKKSKIKNQKSKTSVSTGESISRGSWTIEKLLEKAAKVTDAAEIFSTEMKTEQVDFKFDKLHLMDEKNIQGLGLRIIKDGKIGFASCTNPLDYEKTLDNAIASSKFGQQAKLAFPNKKSPKKVKTVSEEVIKFNISSGVDMVKEGIELIKQRNSEIKCDAGLSKVVSTVRILNSSGLDDSYSQTGFSYGISGLIIIDNSFLDVWETESSCKLKASTKKFADNIIKRVELARKVATMPTKKMNVIFMPRAIPTLISSIMIGVNGKQIQKKTSPITSKLGEKILDEKLSITDDGTLDFCTSSAPFDDEGMPITAKHIIEKGVLKTFLFDLQTAGILNVTPTGNASRGYNSLPSPSQTNIVIAPGTWALQDMIKDMKEGLILYDTIGGGQSNMLAGDFSFNVGFGYKVENGEIVGRVKDTMLSGNVYEAFNNIIGLENSTEEVYGSMHIPAFYFKGMSVTSKN